MCGWILKSRTFVTVWMRLVEYPRSIRFFDLTYIPRVRHISYSMYYCYRLLCAGTALKAPDTLPKMPGITAYIVRYHVLLIGNRGYAVEGLAASQ